MGKPPPDVVDRSCEVGITVFGGTGALSMLRAAVPRNWTCAFLPKAIRYNAPTFTYGGAMSTVVLTGFPGFLASAFVPNLLSRLDADTSVTCLIQSHYRPLAEQRRNEIAAANPAWKDRIRLLEGDITKIGLGLPPAEKDLQLQTARGLSFCRVY